ncbi:MAG: MBL fold metallo-hydrolase [Candidatus Undinarchaeales archaeon]|jgi:glyoxylase-like metal-dependent hydrolase (beta-lactamase superfamily II)|nr:MBL fold metallo-hydrolase [Candidatus Undinarchaeales archaeon]MDP7492014.1 MBL fold metallo-hydrolase [Candidatus Undinarchaeales archaeon]
MMADSDAGEGRERSVVGPLRLGGSEIFQVSDGACWLDGGAMFGVVAKTQWSKYTYSDERNRIELGLHPLLIKAKGKNILVDTGIGGWSGSKYTKKFVDIFGIKHPPTLIQSLREIGLGPEDIDIVINTHLHFDHAGGNACRSDGELAPTFKNARYFVQKSELEDAKSPSERSRASYIREDFEVPENAGQLETVEGNVEIVPGVSTILTPGHTRSHQSVKLETSEGVLVYLGDLIPTTAHLRGLAWIMGYDLFPLTTLETKRDLLREALDGDWTLAFEHDTSVGMGRVKMDDRGRYSLDQVFSFR